MKPIRLALITVAAALALAGCASHRPATQTAQAGPASAPRPAAPVRALLPPLTPAKLAALHADESGRIPILMYHAIGGPSFRGTLYDKEGLNIAPATFRKHLDLMYAAHWYPVNMRDVLTSHVSVPAGKTPVVLTFDDARGTQFRYLKNGQVDPNCAVGILHAFHKKHPDWPLRAAFYVLPQSAWNPVPFWQRGQETKKLRALVADGFEIANHSVTHRPMTHLSASELCWEMAGCDKYVKERVPAATMDTMAVPGGSYPKNHALWGVLRTGRLGQVAYHNRCILMAWGGPSRSWADKKFDSNRIARIGAGPGWVERAIAQLSSGHIPEYVSDGNPDTVSVPRRLAADINPSRLEGARLVVYDDGKSPAPKRKLKAGAKTLVAGKGPAKRA